MTLIHLLRAHAAMWGTEPNLPTCQAPNSVSSARRDYIFVNRFALPLVNGFIVGRDHVIHVHSILKLKLNIKPSHVPRKVINLAPKDLYSDVLGVIRKRLQSNQHSHVDAHDNEHEQEGQQEAKPLTHKQIAEQLPHIHKAIDDAFHARHCDFLRLVNNKDTDGIWALWSSLVVKGLTKNMDSDDDVGKSYSRVGKPTFKEVVCYDDVTFEHTTGAYLSAHAHDEVLHNLRQYRRALTLVGL